MLVTKTAINVIGEIAKKGYLIINKNCKSDLQNSESLFYLKIFFSKILLTQKKSNCYIGTATGNGFENGGFAMRKAKKCNTGKKKFVVVWLALVVLFLGSFIRPVDVQAAKVKLNKSAVTIYRGASTSLKLSGSKKFRPCSNADYTKYGLLSNNQSKKFKFSYFSSIIKCRK